jgi:hypothetical protein
VPVPLLCCLQAEHDHLVYQHQLITDFCKGFDWFRHVQLHALLADPEVMLAGSTAEQLAPGSLNQQLSNILETESEVQLMQQLSSLPASQQHPSNGSAAAPHTAAHNSSSAPISLRDSSYSSISASEASPLAAFDQQHPTGHLHASAAADAAAAAVNGQVNTSQPCPASSSAPTAAPGDVWWLLKQALQQPWPQEMCKTPEDLTPQVLLQHFKATAHELSLQLVKYSACEGAEEQAGPLHNMQQLLLPHLRLIVGLFSHSRGTRTFHTMQLVSWIGWCCCWCCRLAKACWSALGVPSTPPEADVAQGYCCVAVVVR